MKTLSLITISQKPLEEDMVNGKAPKKSGKRVGYNYIIIKSYKESKKNDVVKCLYIKSLTNFGFCVIKEGNNNDSKDKQGRNIIDRLKWQETLHQQLQDKIKMPRFLGHFEERGNYYLVIGHIKGKALYKACLEKRKVLRQSIISGNKLGIKFVDYLIQIAEILEILHKEKIVHRDATPNNYMIMPNGKVALIDMEMCYSMADQFPTPAFQLGTYGYMSKQQEATMTPTTAEDIFALGAIILQLWSGVSPGKLTNEPFDLLQEKISFFIPDKQIAQLVMQCLLPEDHLRPDAKEIGATLKQYRNDLKLKVKRPVNEVSAFSKNDILRAVQESVRTLASPLLADEGKGWFSNDMKPASPDDKHKLNKQWYASFNSGATGIIYMLVQASRVGINIDHVLPFVKQGIDLVKQKYIDIIDRKASGLHFGSDGIAAVLSTAIESKILEPLDEYFEWIDLLLQKQKETFNFIGGVAGQGIANILSSQFLNGQQFRKRLESYVQLLIGQQDKNGFWVSGYRRQRFTGRKIKIVKNSFAEGVAGIVYFLLEYGHRFDHKEAIISAQRGLQWLMKKGKHKNGTVYWVSSHGKELGYGWSEGTAGIALCFLKAYAFTGQPLYKQFAKKALLNIPDGLSDSNLGQKSGLSGLGEVYLEAFKILQEDVWLEKASWLAQVIMRLAKKHPEYGIYWLVEHERLPVGNFMIGTSGVIHFLLRYCYIDRINFPLMPDFAIK